MRVFACTAQRIVANIARQNSRRIWCTHVQRRWKTTNSSSRALLIAIKPQDYPTTSEYVDALIYHPKTPLTLKEALIKARSSWGNATVDTVINVLSEGFVSKTDVDKPNEWSSFALHSTLSNVKKVLAAQHLNVSLTESDAFDQQFRDIAKQFPVPANLSQQNPWKKKLANDIAFVQSFVTRVQKAVSSTAFDAFVAEYRSYQQHCYTKGTTKDSTKPVHLERVRQLLSPTTDASQSVLSAQSDSHQSDLYHFYCEHWDRLMQTRSPELHGQAVTAVSYQKQLHLPLEMRTTMSKSKLKKTKSKASSAESEKLQARSIPKLQARSITYVQKSTVSESEALDRARRWGESHHIAVECINRAVQFAVDTAPASLFVQALKANPPLPAMRYDTTIPFPISSHQHAESVYVDPISFMFPPHWTVSDLQFLSKAQSLMHPIAYYHFRCTLLSLSQILHDKRSNALDGDEDTSSALSLVAGELSSWFNELTSDVSRHSTARLENELISRLDRLCLLTSPSLTTSNATQSIAGSPCGSRTNLTALVNVAWSQSPRFPALDLPFERHCFLTHLHEQALPAHATKLLVCLHRGVFLEHRAHEKTKEDEAEVTAAADRLADAVDTELVKLDESLDLLAEADVMSEHTELNADVTDDVIDAEAVVDDIDQVSEADLSPVIDAEAAVDDIDQVSEADLSPVDNVELDEESARSPTKPIKTSIRRLFLRTAEEMFGSKSLLTQMCALHLREIKIDEWTEARSRAPESEVHQYLSFYVDENVRQEHPLVQHLKREYRQPFIHRLLEANPTLQFSCDRSDQHFNAFSREHANYMLFLTDIHPDISPRELMFALRRMSDVRGGEIYRERVSQSVLQSELTRVRNEVKAIGMKRSKTFGASVKQSRRSSVYCAVYFSSLAGVARCMTASNALLGITYRSHMMIPHLPSSVTRVRIYCPSGHLRSYNTLMSQISHHINAVCEPKEVISMGDRQSLSDTGVIMIECHTHDAALKIANTLSLPNMISRHMRVSLYPLEHSRINLQPDHVNKLFT